MNKKAITNTIFVMAFVVFALLAAFTICTPDKAYAKSYSLPSTNIEATLNADGSMNVVQEREYDFSGDYTLATIDLGTLPQNSTLTLESASINGVVLNEVEFQPSWRSYGGPGVSCYSFDKDKNKIYFFGSYSNEKVKFALSYNITNCINVYSDVAEFYWKFVGAGWEVASENVTAKFNIPAPANASKDNIRAWAHGPLSGRVSIDSVKNVTCTAKKVDAGQFAEARIVFPSSWMSIPSTSSVGKLQSILDEEQKFADEANAERYKSLLYVGICALVALLFIGLCVILFFKYGKEYKPEFTDAYWRDAPEPGINPAVVARLLRWNKQDTSDLTSSIIYLNSKGVLKIEPVKTVKKRLIGSDKEEIDYKFIRSESVQAPIDDVDKATLNLLFDIVGGSNDEILFSDINNFAKSNPSTFSEAVTNWQNRLDISVDNKCFFDEKSETFGILMKILSLSIACVGLFVGFWFDNFLPSVFCIVAGIVGLILSHFMKRRTRYGVEIYAKSIALKKWLCEFTALKEKPATDVKVWGMFMAYAFALGVSKEAIEQLKVYAPQMFDDEDIYGYDILPWYFWYSSGYWSRGGLFGSGQGFSDVFDSTFSNTMATVSEALDAVSGGLSSGGGFGGGFSVGGGGGFGGGGGGAR